MNTCTGAVMKWVQVLLVQAALSVFVMGKSNEETVELTRQVSGNGFHRDIQTTLQLQKEDLKLFPGSQCSFQLVETVPKGLYVDMFQLRNVAAMGGPQVSVDHPVNIEAPEYLAPQHKLCVYAPLPFSSHSTDSVVNVSVSITVHARYHRPEDSPHASHVPALMYHPKIFISCSDKEIHPQTSCDPEKISVETWTALGYRSTTEYVEIQVPVGRRQDEGIVTLSTMAVTVFGCTFILCVIAFYDTWKLRLRNSGILGFL